MKKNLHQNPVDTKLYPSIISKDTKYFWSLWTQFCIPTQICIPHYIRIYIYIYLYIYYTLNHTQLINVKIATMVEQGDYTLILLYIGLFAPEIWVVGSEQCLYTRWTNPSLSSKLCFSSNFPRSILRLTPRKTKKTSVNVYNFNSFRSLSHP